MKNFKIIEQWKKQYIVNSLLCLFWLYVCVCVCVHSMSVYVYIHVHVDMCIYICVDFFNRYNDISNYFIKSFLKIRTFF